MSFRDYEGEYQQCVNTFLIEHRYQQQYHLIGASIALFFFPFFVFLGCGLAAAILLLGAGRGGDLVIVVVAAAVL